ncbi:hypothetical protein ABZ863_24170 [Saccharomonospora sp. NPDC046836]|uniref:hypothetical protein n=1 Tax=Saccharomonospora sp. NPDC046836 TaxID=3156921 RepID=UPI0033F331B6
MAFVMATPTSSAHPPGHGSTDTVAILAQAPLPDCAGVAAPLPPPDIPDTDTPRLLLAALGTPQVTTTGAVSAAHGAPAAARAPPAR